MAARDLKVACRTLLGRPALPLGVVLTLGLGMGATTTVYSVVDAVVLRPLQYADADRLVTVRSLPATTEGIDPETGLQDLAPFFQMIGVSPSLGRTFLPVGGPVGGPQFDSNCRNSRSQFSTTTRVARESIPSRRTIRKRSPSGVTS